MTLVPEEITLVPEEITLVPETEMTLVPDDTAPPAICRSSKPVSCRSVSFLRASLREGDC